MTKETWETAIQRIMFRFADIICMNPCACIKLEIATPCVCANVVGEGSKLAN